MKIINILPLLFIGQLSFGQATVLSADGPGDTYELINSVLAPGYDVTEPPDCAHTGFGRHCQCSRQHQNKQCGYQQNTSYFRFDESRAG